MTSNKTPPDKDQKADYHRWHENETRREQHDRLWKSLKWFPPLVENWGWYLGLIVFIVYIAGEDFINNLAAWALKVLP